MSDNHPHHQKPFEYRDTVDFGRLDYSELALPFTPSKLTMKICIGRRGANMIQITKLCDMAWIYWREDRGVFELYGEGEADEQADAAEQADEPPPGDFEKAKTMLRDCMVFAITRATKWTPAGYVGNMVTAEELQWATHQLAGLPANHTYRVMTLSSEGTRAAHSLVMSGPAHAAVDFALHAGTMAGLPGNGSVRFDRDNCTIAYITCVGNGAYNIRASDDHALHTSSSLIQDVLFQYASWSRDPTLAEWVERYGTLYYSPGALRAMLPPVADRPTSAED